MKNLPMLTRICNLCWRGFVIRAHPCLQIYKQRTDYKSAPAKAIVLLLVLHILCTSCIKVPYEEIPITLSVSTNSLIFSPSGAQLTFSISSNDSWNVSSTASWLNVSPSNGSFSNSVTVIAAANTSTSSRTATISVSSNVPGVEVQTIAVSQAGTTAAQVRFKKDGNFSDYTQMGIRNTNGAIVASDNFGYYAGTSNYYTVSAGTYTPVFYNSSLGWVTSTTSSPSTTWTVSLSAGNRYTIRLYANDTGGFSTELIPDGSFVSSDLSGMQRSISQGIQSSPPAILSK